MEILCTPVHLHLVGRCSTSLTCSKTTVYEISSCSGGMNMQNASIKQRPGTQCATYVQATLTQTHRDLSNSKVRLLSQDDTKYRNWRNFQYVIHQRHMKTSIESKLHRQNSERREKCSNCSSIIVALKVILKFCTSRWKLCYFEIKYRVVTTIFTDAC